MPRPTHFAARFATRFVAPVLLAAVPAALAAAAPADTIGTLQTGRYVCELPGDALGAAGIHRVDADFVILNASGYQAVVGAGSYLLVGKTVTFTSGPRQGEQFRLVTSRFLRRLNGDGSDNPLRCVLRNRNNR